MLRRTAQCISPGGIVTGIFAKTGGVSGSDADRVLGVILNRFASVQPISGAAFFAKQGVFRAFSLVWISGGSDGDPR
jgi:hypothetical protein